MSTESPDTWDKLSDVNRLNIFGQVVRVLSVLLTHITVVRALNHSDLSDYSWVYALCIFPQTLFTLGFEQSFSYFFPRFLVNGDRENIRKLFKYAMMTVVLFSIAGYVIFSTSGSGLLIYLSQQRLLALLAVTLLANIIFAFAQIPIGALRGLQHFKHSLIAEQYLLPGLPFLFVLLACFTVATPMTVIAAQGVGFFLTAIYAYYNLFQGFNTEKLQAPIKQPPQKEFKTWLYYSIPIALMLTSETVFNWVILSVTGTILTDLEVSFIGIAIRSIQMFTFLSMAVAPILMPKISQHAELDDREALKEIVHKMSYWLTCWSLVIAFGLAINRYFVLSIFGADFAVISGLILWLIPGGIIEGIGAYIKLASLSVGQNLYGFWLYFSGSILTAIVCYYAALSYGAKGALLAGSIGFFYINLTRMFIFLRFAKTSLYSKIDTFKVLGVTTILGVFCVVMEKNLLPEQQLIRLVSSVALGLIILTASLWKDRKILLGAK